MGSGAVLLPNHAPLTIAEQFGLLAGLYPERVDLGLGRGAEGIPRRRPALAKTVASLGRA